MFRIGNEGGEGVSAIDTSTAAGPLVAGGVGLDR